MYELNGKIRKKTDEMLLYAIILEFQLFGSVWAMLNVSGILYLFLYWGFVGLAIIKLCIQGNTWKEWLFIVTFGGIAFVSFRGSADKTPLLLMLGVCCAKNVNLGRLIKVDLIGRIMSSLIQIIFPLMGICENQIKHNRGVDRIYFGWQAPNGMGLSFLVICMEWMYLRHRHFKWFDYMGILALTVFLHQTANSRTAEFLMIGILVIEFLTTFLEKYRDKTEQYKLWAAGCAGALCLDMLAPVIAMYLYFFRNQELMALKGTFIARFQLPGKFYEAHGLSLFGRPYDPTVYDYLDMLFAYLTLHLGIVIAIIVLALIVAGILYGYRKKDEKLLLLFMFILLRSVVESEHFTLVYTFFPVLLGLAVWQAKESVPKGRPMFSEKGKG